MTHTLQYEDLSFQSKTNPIIPESNFIEARVSFHLLDVSFFAKSLDLGKNIKNEVLDFFSPHGWNSCQLLQKAFSIFYNHSDLSRAL